ncbi:MAG: nucleoside monophosphate kinase [Candidatus Saccharibacteria bacterium]|nr:nucleoside monophosphate kinase [Candidatus Saccharibacteria bacterium]
MMYDKIDFLKIWLRSGSINIFGLPMSGKDTIGIRLATDLEGEFLSSGDIIRRYESENNVDLTSDGSLAPTDTFYQVVLPYFSHPNLSEKPLVLSSIGRWSGEENEVMKFANAGNHPIRAVVNLEVPEVVVRNRWQAAQRLNDRGRRADDMSPEIFERRINEFNEKTLPVLKHYEELNLLANVDANATRDEVYANVIDALFEFATNHPISLGGLND